MGQPRRSFTPEVKQEAVDLCRRSGTSECQVARELGIPQPTFNRWMRQVATAGPTAPRHGSHRRTDHFDGVNLAGHPGTVWQNR